MHDPSGAADPHHLQRFLNAQESAYATALAEIHRGQKRSHWIWFVFPQFEGLGFSETSRRFSIKSIAEAEAYLAHPILGRRLIECAEAAYKVDNRTALQIFGSPDDLKLRSCATLFALVSPSGSVFHRLLEKYFAGEQDAKTVQLVRPKPNGK